MTTAFFTGSADDLFDHLPCTCKESITRAITTVHDTQEQRDNNPANPSSNSSPTAQGLDHLLAANKASLATITAYLDCLSIHDASLVLLVCHLLQKMLSLYQDAWFATTAAFSSTATASASSSSSFAAPPNFFLEEQNQPGGGLTITFGRYELSGEDAQALARQIVLLDVTKIGGVLRRLEEGDAIYGDTGNTLGVLRRSLKQELKRLKDRLSA
ncbi:hypothetical protein MPH_04390 [Macrophomina phaseolina MS6]|uniref:Aflatoxin regulatory protein domain-containing protein n=2 Tax=Macrophomina phaseolina TaxID=35725 RepID=K2S7M9_MACPH|nr:hypothetical protein MPH_04390 [Macrophomina phaseolina MS6]